MEIYTFTYHGLWRLKHSNILCNFQKHFLKRWAIIKPVVNKIKEAGCSYWWGFPQHVVFSLFIIYIKVNNWLSVNIKQNISQFKMISYNVKGLGTPEKRSAIFRELRNLKAQIVFLQETHFQKGTYPRIPDKRYNKIYHAGSPDKMS